MVALYLVPPKGGEHSGQAPKALAVRTEIIAQAQVAGNSVRARRLRRSACRLSGLRRHQKQHPRVVEAQLGERGRNTDFSDALGDRRIEEIQPPRFAGASPRKGHETLHKKRWASCSQEGTH